MIQCPGCGEVFSSGNFKCPVCFSGPTICNGITVWNSEEIEEGKGFNPDFFAKLAGLETKHFWFRVRNKLIVRALDKYCPWFDTFLEIGCGTGYVLSGISSRWPQRKIYGSEIFSEGLVFATKRVPKAHLMQMDARNLPFVEEFDAIGAFDVLEHIKKDEQVMEQVWKALKPGGIFLLTVPQHKWLWSRTDEHSCHVRRYEALEIHEKLNDSGFEIVRSMSFVSLLLPLMYLSRFAGGKTGKPDLLKELRINPIINKICEGIALIEESLINKGIDFPLGGSRMVVAKKI